MDFEALWEYVIKILENELNPIFTYHSCKHTCNVVKASEGLAGAENLNQKDILLTMTAALLHDIGYIDDFRNHEASSASIAGKILPSFGYESKDIDIIQKLILATKSPRVPKSLMEKIICDADLDYLGREDYFIHAYKYRLEMENLGIKYTLTQWYEIQFKFLTSHRYYTKTAKKTRDQKRKQHINEIADLLKLN